MNRLKSKLQLDCEKFRMIASLHTKQSQISSPFNDETNKDPLPTLFENSMAFFLGVKGSASRGLDFTCFQSNQSALVTPHPSNDQSLFQSPLSPLAQTLTA